MSKSKLKLKPLKGTKMATKRKKRKTTRSAARKSKNVSTKKKVKKYVRGSLHKGIYAYFDHAGIDAVAYKETERLAKKIKPDTKFDKSHFAWYRADYKQAKTK